MQIETNMKLKNYILIVFCFGLILGARANVDINFSKIGTEQGLSQLSVMNIYQDELGTIWLATREGLNRYNGNNVEVFRPNPKDSNSLGESLIMNVCGDKKNHLYIHTQNSVNQFDIRSSSMSVIQKSPVDLIYFANDLLWIAEFNQIFTYKDGKKVLFLTVEQSTSAIKQLLLSSDGHLYIGTLSSGVFVVDKNKKIRPLIENSSQVSDIYEDSRKNIWISTWQKGVFKLERNGNLLNFRHSYNPAVSSISSDFARCVCEENSNVIWIGTKKGLDRLNQETGEISHYNSKGYNPANRLSNESVWSLYKDEQGTIWVGTYFGGLNYFNPDINFYNFHHLQNGEFLNKPFPVISSILEADDNSLFLCSEGDGLIHYNLLSKTYKVYRADTKSTNSLSADNIKAAYYDKRNDELWLGTHLGGLCLFNTKTESFSQFKQIKSEWPESRILSAVVPYKDKLLVGTHDGLFLFEKKDGSFTLFSSKLHQLVKYIQDVKVDNTGNIWIANIQGVYKFNPNTNKVNHYYFDADNKHSLSNNNVSKILIDSKQRVWIATSGGGVNLYQSATNDFLRFNSEDMGLNNDFVSNLIESKFGYLLVSTTRGFSMLDPENQKVYNYSSDNGLPLNSLYSGGLCLTSKGAIFMSGMNGMVAFNEENLAVPERKIRLQLVKLFINNKEILPEDKTGVLDVSLPYTNGINLNYKQNMLTIEFASNNYIPENQPKFRYMLQGYSDSWTELPLGANMLNFMNLSSGKYQLIVEAVSLVDEEVIASTKLEIRIQPPFYLSWYAWLFYTLLVFFVVWRYLKFSSARLLLETSLKYEKKEKEHLEEVNQSKLRFFTNISHEFRTPLTLISGQVDMMMQMNNIPPAIYNRILNIKRNTVNMNYLVNELLEFRKTEQGHLNIKASEIDFVKFLYEIYLSFSEYAVYRTINLHFKTNSDQLNLWFDPVQMQKVFYNLISNAFKFTSQNGTVNIYIEDDVNVVYVKIEDTGIGIAKEEIDKIFDRFYQAENGIQLSTMLPGTGIGLALTKSILELHQAEISVESKANVGSIFTIRLKKGSSHFADEQKVEYQDADRVSLDAINELDATFMNEVRNTQVVDDLPKFSMLIVEDNDELRNMLKNIFEPIYKIYTASNGQEGLDATVEHQPDIVLSDLMMPLMSGSEMCQKIKNNFAVCHIPVVLLTAQTAIEFNLESLRLGADDYITKPFNVKTLITRCNNLVNNRRLLQEKFSMQPETTPRMLATNKLDLEFLEKAQKIVEEHIDDSNFDVMFFASEMALGRTKLFTKLKGITGQTPNEFILSVRLKKAASLLANNPEYNITDITYMLGFSSPKYFAKCFKELFSVSPSSFRKTDEIS